MGKNITISDEELPDVETTGLPAVMRAQKDGTEFISYLDDFEVVVKFRTGISDMVTLSTVQARDMVLSGLAVLREMGELG